MCDTCGCGDPEFVPVAVQKHLLGETTASRVTTASTSPRTASSRST
jgi:hypothetical protein